MKPSKHISEESSLLTANVSLGLLLIGGLLAAYFGQSLLSLLLLLLLTLMAFARLWAMFALRRLSLRSSLSTAGLFPGETAKFRITIRNEKFLPLPWSTLYFPLPEDQCVLPDELREPGVAELQELRDRGLSPRQVGEARLPALSWYGELTREVSLHAVRRGVFSLKPATLRGGDGLGLAAEEIPLGTEETLAVFPAWQPVRTDPLTQNLWVAQTGHRGYQEEPTLIRSMRPYQPGDRAKDINWRMAANAQPLSLNVHETILPHSLHFIFDGESFFRGKDPEARQCHWTVTRVERLKEMEEALSILGSLLITLNEKGIPTGLTLCRGASGRGMTLGTETALEDKLFALAGYRPLNPDCLPGADGPEEKKSIFPWRSVIREDAVTGRYLYIARDARAVGLCGVEEVLEGSRIRQLLWRMGQESQISAAELRSLREAEHEA